MSRRLCYLLTGLMTLAFSACDNQASKQTPPADPPAKKPDDKPVAKPADQEKPRTMTPQPANTTAATQPARSGPPRVRFKTNLGEFVIELDPEKAPITSENILSYVDESFFSQTVVHRIVPGFVIQLGGFDTQGREKPTHAQIKNEWQNGLKNRRGTVSMARTPAADSATSQFFVNLQDNAALDMARPGPDGVAAAYAVFGRVVSGMDVVDKIAAQPTGPGMIPGENSRPLQPIIVESAVRE